MEKGKGAVGGGRRMMIGICDDDRDWCRRAAEEIRLFAQNIGQDAEVIPFYSGDEIREWKQ